MSKQLEMKQDNAHKAGLSPKATQAYLQGLVGLKSAENFVSKGNKGKGYRL